MKTIFGGTDTGIIREANQDGFVCGEISENTVYAVLCDGMGGENGGGVASELAISFADDALKRGLKDGMEENAVRAVLESAIAGANALVYDAAVKDKNLAGMGTTMITAVLSGNTLYTAYVGDSRVYIISGDTEKQVSHDHTVVQMLVDIGEITEEAAKIHPQRHYITRAVGVGTSVDSDFAVEQMNDGDIALLCSDGLYNYLETGKTPALVRECLSTGSAAPLIEYANMSGGSDNITAVLMAR